MDYKYPTRNFNGGEVMKRAFLVSLLAVLNLVLVLQAGSPQSKPPAAEIRGYFVIQDDWNDTLAVETKNITVLSELVQMYRSGERKWVCGTVELYRNRWGFRLKPETIFTGEVTAEALQTTIRGVSDNMDYWLDSTACFSSIVVKIRYV